MELYIEKVILDQLNIDFLREKLSIGQQKLRDILYSYDGIKFFVDFNYDAIQFENYKIENPLFTKIVERNVITSISYVESIKDHFFKYSDCKQTLFFTQNEEDWFSEAEHKGALCFTYCNYQQKIEEIVNKCHFKIDLSQKFNGWESILLCVQELMPLNKIIINDSYLLDKPEFYETSLYPLIKGISNNKKTSKHFYTDITNSSKKRTPLDKIKIYNILKEKYKSSEIVLIHNNVDNLRSHDRILYSNFYLIDCAIGFNLNPVNTSNSQIIFETIFEIYTYKRLKNHINLMEKHLDELVHNMNFTLYYPI